MHLAVFLLGYASASVFGVFILSFSLGNSVPVQLYPYFLRFIELYIDWSVGFCFLLILLYLAVEFVRSQYFPQSYRKENVFLLRFFNAVDRVTLAKIRNALASIIKTSGRRD
ncbi:MAG: hypothetical protein SD837_22090 [Candidatus Electrothrix scaldis]|nr:MAG: hypothetical protein SD837_22090 [Candidatus Electrothrix sp. GW3-3]